jgi:aminoglycoside phosphotransferase (APT) family kinase protein
MNIQPRFLAGASRRPFVDRDNILQAFKALCSRKLGHSHILNLYGVGGIGKSRILAQLSGYLPSGSSSALLDLHIPSMRQHLNALAALRLTFGQHGIRFDRFDIGFLVLWQRLNPTLELSLKNQIPISGSEILTDIASSIGGVPLVGTASKLLTIAGSNLRRWHHVRNDDVLQELDGLRLDELTDAVTYLFVRDLRSDLTNYPILFIDAYEALIGGLPLGANRAAADSWLRDLVAQMNGLPVVIASREPIEWDVYSSSWSEVVHTMELYGLPDWARLELLRATGIDNPVTSEKISAISEGVPYFLLLAADSGQIADETMTRERILERFLQHVDPHYVRALELLSLVRAFTKDVYDVLAEHFDLVRDSHTWDCISSYSFVVPVGGALRLHRLMVATLEARLPLDTRIQAHQVLATYWLDLASCQAINLDARAEAYTEAAYHGTKGQWAVESLLDIADRLTHVASPSGVCGIISDLEDYISTTNSLRGLDSLKALLDAELLLLHGQTSTALVLTESFVNDGLSAALVLRHRLNLGHCLRILGRTSEALEIYTRVWQDQNSNSVGRSAGHWVADLQMAMGDFAGSLETVDILLSTDDPSQTSSLYRLKHLSYRFAFDYIYSDEYLAKAMQLPNNGIVARANLLTNRIELDAIIQPVRALERFNEALEAQSTLRAEPELGKLWCAKALAYFKLEELGKCAEALANGVQHLERATYQSGLGRAFLYQAALLARLGNSSDAIKKADKAIKILLEAEVYPTLIVLAVKLCESLGKPSPERSSAELSARSQIRLPFGADDLDLRIKRLGILYPESDSLLAAAMQSTESMSGFYNRNVRVGEILVRTRLQDAPVMDLTIWNEADVLAVLEKYSVKTPRLLSLFREEGAQFHDFIHGRQLNQILPKGSTIPQAWTEQIMNFFLALRLIPKSELPSTPQDWPKNGDSIGFAHEIEAVTRRVEIGFRSTHHKLWARLGIPENPLNILSWNSLSRRDYSLLHCDIHRKNIIVTPEEGLIFLDWELALWGDPLYDLAVHIHKMDYPDFQSLGFIKRWAYLMGYDYDIVWSDLQTYLCHEQVKSALVDSVRYASLVAPGVPEKRLEELSIVLTRKLNRARRVWGITEVIGPEEVSKELSLS